MKLYCSEQIYFDTEDGYYYIGNTPYITEDEAIEAQVQEPCRG